MDAYGITLMKNHTLQKKDIYLFSLSIKKTVLQVLYEINLLLFI